MCYNIKTLRWSQMVRARNRERFKNLSEEKIEDALDKVGVKDYHQVSGFSHPNLLIYPGPDTDPFAATWGLVPETFEGEDPNAFWKQYNTLNATIEKMYWSNAYRDYSTRNHCLIYVNGFYEHHTVGKAKYPFFISMKGTEQFALAGIWAKRIHPTTKTPVLSFSIVTTVANPAMAKIHNVHAVSDGPRQPIILNEEMADRWLTDGFNSTTAKQFKEPFQLELLNYQTVGKLSGKDVQPNLPSASDKLEYYELNDFMQELESTIDFGKI